MCGCVFVRVPTWDQDKDNQEIELNSDTETLIMNAATPLQSYLSPTKIRIYSEHSADHFFDFDLPVVTLFLMPLVPWSVNLDIVEVALQLTLDPIPCEHILQV